MSITFITGGAASGKSTRALELGRQYGDNVLFVATCVADDDEMRKKVKRHQSERPSTWKTLEAYKTLGDKIGNKYKVAIIDCVTLLVSKMLVDGESDENIYKEIESLLQKTKIPLIIVSNEVGMGLVPETVLGRRFREVLGRANRIIAERARVVEMIVSGQILTIKGEK